MEITITIKIDDHELLNSKNEETRKEVKGNYSQYAMYFDERNPKFDGKHPEFNRIFLATQQHYANDLLKTKGYLFLNDVYKMLGLPETKAGQIVGWVYNTESPFGDNYVDFGIFDERNKNFINGKSNIALLDFNVDGNILELL